MGVFAWTQLTSQIHKITLDDVQHHIYLEGRGWETQHTSRTAPGVSFFAEFCAQTSYKETSSMLGRLLQSLILPRANISCKNNKIGTISKVPTWDMSVTNSVHLGKPGVLPHVFYSCMQLPIQMQFINYRPHLTINNISEQHS